MNKESYKKELLEQIELKKQQEVLARLQKQEDSQREKDKLDRER